jgi:hypothetical protein
MICKARPNSLLLNAPQMTSLSFDLKNHTNFQHTIREVKIKTLASRLLLLPPLSPRKNCAQIGVNWQGCQFRRSGGWTRLYADRELGAIFSKGGLDGAALFGYFFLLLTKFSGKILNTLCAARRV